ncbi:hypothetical protein NUW58_g4372 [Xylaria curta]|uniref:Uncharacterized protein n=1 Tax=Xylaria curta TaxID=42375 RepID=A0ACC1P8C1_9PEZI|nr:hypothetical protein NUW58_g4372 [Xylaria curta]
MCIYRKFVFLCNHTQLYPEAYLICTAQEERLSKGRTGPCDEVSTHRASTFRIMKTCEQCEDKKKTTERQFSNVKQKMAVLRQHLEETYSDCMKHLDEVGLKLDEEDEKDEKNEKSEESEVKEIDPTEAFLQMKKKEKYSHLMMLH